MRPGINLEMMGIRIILDANRIWEMADKRLP